MTKITKPIGYLITIASLYFLSRNVIIATNSSLLLNSITDIPITIIFSLLIISFSSIFGCFQWKVILEFLSKKSIGFSTIFPIFVKSNVAKYIPGNIFQYASRNILGHTLGWKHKQVALSSLLEIVLSIIVFALVFSIILLAGLINLPSNMSQFKTISLFPPITFFILLLLVIFIKIKYGALLFPLTRLFVKVFTLSLWNYIIAGVTLALIISATSHTILSFTFVFKIFSAFTISYYIGYITPGAPGGLGVREALLLVILSGDFSKTLIINSVLIHRVISILSDFIVLFFSYFVDKVHGKYPKNAKEY